MRSFAWGSLFVSALVASGCHTTSDTGGGTPVTLSPATAGAYERYKEYAEGASALAVSTDGKIWATRHCYETRCRTAADALEACNDRATSNGSGCRLFAKGRAVVWKGPVTYPEFGENGHLFSLTIRKKNGAGTVTYGGEATVPPGRSHIQLTMRAGSNRCDGGADTTTMKWRIACLYAESYEGSFTDGARALYVGTGTSALGRRVWLSIFPKK